MGVGITAYSKLKKAMCHFNEHSEPIDPKTGEYLDGVVQFYVNPSFPGRADDIEDNVAYEYEENDGRDSVSYSYGYYNRLRNELARFAGYSLGQYKQYGRMDDSYCVDCWNGKTGPFSELINVSDCEGVIGASVSAKLSSDFENRMADIESHDDEQFIRFFKSMASIFKIASNGGAVSFS